MERISDFVSFPLFIKLRNFDFENNWNALLLFDKKDMTSDLNMSHGKMSECLPFELLMFTLLIKLINFDFGNHWNALIFLDQKKMMSDLKIFCQAASNLV